MDPPVLTLLHRGKSHTIQLSGTQRELQSRIEAATTVPPAEQTLLHKGKKLSLSPDAPISELHLSRKAMLLRRPAATRAAPTRATPSPLLAAEKRVDALRSTLEAARAGVSRHVQGFLTREMTLEALGREEKAVKGVEEGVMNVVEMLDGLTVPDEGADAWRALRRGVVKKAQAVLADVDRVHETITELREDRWGEVESRRGKG